MQSRLGNRRMRNRSTERLTSLGEGFGSTCFSCFCFTVLCSYESRNVSPAMGLKLDSRVRSLKRTSAETSAGESIQYVERAKLQVLSSS